MTITPLIKRLEKLRAKHGNVKMCVDADGIRSGTGNGTWGIVNVSDVIFLSVPQVDGDGFAVINKNGQEREHACAVIK